MAKPVKRIPEGYGMRSLEAIRDAVMRGLRLDSQGRIVLPCGRVANAKPQNGYRSVNLGRNGKGITVTAARIVCYLAHGEPPHPSYIADHIDGDTLNDHPSNLRWSTYQENTLNNSANRASGVTPQRIQACLAACKGIADPVEAIKSLQAIREAAREVIGTRTGDHPEWTEAALKDLARTLGYPVWR